MRVYIDCAFDDGDQTLIMPDATEKDYRTLKQAAASGDGVVIVNARVTPDGPVQNRLVRANRIRSVRRDSA